MPSLENLIQHYQRFADGLPTELKFPVKAPPPPQINVHTIPRLRKTTQLTEQPISGLNTSKISLSPSKTLQHSHTTKEKHKIGKSTAKHIIDGFRSLNKKPKPSASGRYVGNEETELDLKTSPLTSLQFQTEFHSVESYQSPRALIDAKHYFEMDTAISAEALTSYYQNPAVTFIPKEKLIFEEKLGSGEFGCVFRGQYIYKNRNLPVAIKTLYPEHSDADQMAFLREAELMMNLNHPCIVRLIGICDVSKNILLSPSIQPPFVLILF